MAAERLSLAHIERNLDILDNEEKVVAGGVVLSIGFTNAAVKDLAPREHEELAAYLFALLDREPVKSSRALAGHRIVLGALATELRGFAAAAGIPTGGQADLRAASTQAEEQRIRARLRDQQAAAQRHGDDVIAAHRAQREHDDAYIPDEPEPQEDDTTSGGPAATPTETDDDLAFL